jgi:predicted solute-binding protein
MSTVAKEARKAKIKKVIDTYNIMKKSIPEKTEVIRAVSEKCGVSESTVRIYLKNK